MEVIGFKNIKHWEKLKKKAIGIKLKKKQTCDIQR